MRYRGEEFYDRVENKKKAMPTHSEWNTPCGKF